MPIMTDATVPGPRTPIWKELETHAARLSSVATRELVSGDSRRFEHFSTEAVGLLMERHGAPQLFRNRDRSASAETPRSI